LVEQDGRIHNFDPASGSVVVPNQSTLARISALFPKSIPIGTAASVGFPERTLVRNDAMNIDPRFGFAWRTGLSNLVVRGGYGIFHNSEAQRVFQAMTAGPFVATETFDNGISAGAPLFAWPQAFPSGGSARPLGIQDLNATAVNFRNSYVQQWNLTLEKQLGANGLRLSYIASSAIRLPFRRNINQPRASTTPFNQNLRPYPVVRNIIFADSGGTQSYESFQAEFTRRLNTGIALDSNYTWSKNLTDVRETNVLGDIILDAYNRRAERGNAECASARLPRRSSRPPDFRESPLILDRRVAEGAAAVAPSQGNN